jgi:DNA primase
MMQCPYHSNGQERRPSAGIHKETGVFHCFACGETHSLAEFISYCFDKDDDGIYGWRWLLRHCDSNSIGERKDVHLDLVRCTSVDLNHISSGVRTRNNGWGDNRTSIEETITEEELNSYRYIHPYMYERGLTDYVIELFDIGYDRTCRCITFPVRDIQGNCLFLARRSVDYKFFNYPTGVEKPLYGLYELYHHDAHSFPDEVIICESMLDALSFWTINKYAVALNGLGTKLQFQQLRDLPCRKLILCTDMDEAGLKARGRIRKCVPNKIITEYILPKNRKDANECTKEELNMLSDVIAKR